MSARLKKMYDEKVAPALKSKFDYGNPHQIPKVVKVVANMGLGEAVQNPKILDLAQKELTQIAGQKGRRDSCQEVHRYLPTSRGDANRLCRDASPRTNVGILGPHDERGATSST